MLSTARGALPLYSQIKTWLVGRISSGAWHPGELIPSEVQLAQELNVSQGTVRKAITELVENNVLIRKQGKGTFVANHDHERTLFHFFHIVDQDEHKVLPDSTTLSCHRRKADSREIDKLQLTADSQVIFIERIRKLSNKPTMYETITLPSEYFAGLGEKGSCDLPNALYKLYEEKFGITIHSAKEQLRASAANKHAAKHLQLAEGSPLLEIERIALTLDKVPVELRISQCNTDKYHYQNTIF
jgi:GntR family transcriptional regulator